MKRVSAFLFLLLSAPLLAQVPGKAVTVPVTLDHNRIVIDVYVPLKDGTTKRVRGLVDTGTTELMISPRVAQMVGATLACDGSSCKIEPPPSILVGGTKIATASAGSAKVPVRPTDFNDVLIPGMSPEVVIPSTVLKNYDLAIDYANRQFTIGPPGSIQFAGTPAQVKLADNGLLTVTAEVNGRSYIFGLDTGSPATLVVPEELAAWRQKQPNWPYSLGALGAENMTGGPDELQRQMLRLPTLQFGGVALRDVLTGSGATPAGEFAKASHNPVIGIIGGEAFKSARVGLDYAHSRMYIETSTGSPITGLDVVGLTLRPEVDGRYTVVAVVPFEGQSSVPEVRAGDVLVGVDGAPVTGATLGQVWSLLGGEPGQVRKLIVDRDGKRLTIEAHARRFLSSKAN